MEENYCDVYEVRKKDRFAKRRNSPFCRDAYMRKYVKSDNVDGVDQVRRVLDTLPEDGCDKVISQHEDSLYFSLNKKSRWNLKREFESNFDEWNDAEDDDERVSKRVAAFEFKTRPDGHLNPNLWIGHGQRRRANCVAYHGVENDSENENRKTIVHRYAKHAMAQEKTLAEKPKPKESKKRKQKNRRNAAQEEQPEEQVEEVATEKGSVEIRYDLITPCESASLRERARKNGARFFGNEEEKSHPKKESILARKMLSKDLYDEVYDEDGCFMEEMDDQMVDGQEVNDRSVDLLIVPIMNLLQNSKTQNDKDVLSKKKRQRELKRLRKLRTVSEMDAYLQAKYVDQASRDESSSSNDQPRVDSAPQTSRFANLFEMIPAEALAIDETLEESYLHRVFGEDYYECSSVPRRFCVDISCKMQKLLPLIYEHLWSGLDARAICIFEVMPPKLASLFGSGVNDYEMTATPVKVWLNGAYTKQVQGLYVNTINACLPQTVDQLVTRVVKMAGTLPLNFYKQEKSQLASFNGVRSAPAKLMVKDQLEIIDQKKATGEILTRAEMSKKLQRQITAVAQFDWFCDVGENLCNVCYDWPIDEIGFCMAQCRHWFCTPCWRAYCTERILNGYQSIHCPFPKCKTAVDYDTLTTFLPLPICHLYAEQIRDRFITKNGDHWFWCPNPTCGRVVHVESEKNSSNLYCACGHVWCTNCSASSHWPASCEDAKAYTERLKQRLDDPSMFYSESRKRIDFVEVKKCPHCNILMEKGVGCNCMTCQCGKMFCWGCQKPWELGTHDSCYSAGKINSGFQKVVLIDVSADIKGALSLDMYRRSLAHRFAVFSPRLGRLKRQLGNCWKSSKKLDMLMQCEELEWRSSKFDFNVVCRQVTAADRFVQKFFELYRQAHYLLEYVYVHLQFQKPKTYKRFAIILTSADRFEFVLNRLEEACECGDLCKVVQYMKQVEMLLQCMLKNVDFPSKLNR